MKSDICCLQEVIDANNQLNSIKDALPNYGYVGEKRNSHIKGLSAWLRLTSFFAQDEYCPIFYNQEKMELKEAKTFGINGEGSYLPRICVRARFKELATGKEFYVYNTHLDHKYEDVRTMQAKLIAKDITKECGNRPVILMGDFNTEFNKDMKKILTENGFTHAKTVANKVEGPEVTHERGSTKQLIECDYIVIKPKDKFNVILYKTFDTMSEKTSDHNPVSMTFSLNE